LVRLLVGSRGQIPRGQIGEKAMKTRYSASIEFDGRKIQISYNTPRELVRALRDMGQSTTANMHVRKLYTKGNIVCHASSVDYGCVASPDRPLPAWLTAGHPIVRIG
jgi:hypothetical protein